MAGFETRRWKVLAIVLLLGAVAYLRRQSRRRFLESQYHLKSRVFVVTGGASGIGRHLTGRLLARGHKVVSTDINYEALQAIMESSWKVNGVRCVIMKHDVRSPEAWTAVIEMAVKTFGSLDVLLNVAGYIHPAPAYELDVKQLDVHIDVNTKVFPTVEISSSFILSDCPPASREGMWLKSLVFCVPGDDHRVAGGCAADDKAAPRPHCEHRLHCRPVFPSWDCHLQCQQGFYLVLFKKEGVFKNKQFFILFFCASTGSGATHAVCQLSCWTRA